ncbi:ArsR family transcriptional regulator [Clostridium tetanomorphum]|nr:metalloregulator ArsR/SmtB family transcription factor [Clostridium tetanomorphum]KAJ49340.1 ArsR family transcriptional regulator [Clostridium tetanomorphum DSM 665]KAJ53231.1 ArsR family transcriptional regulator [Clostridium tetanomorphum DSM 665]MBP1865738.1 ArsR family transcriptional regulator [Clostridium tetanomorphum]NRS86858.1 ArsR family transcriptional regulator [Clostridium tetanomorphum]NRZ99384.1 ArsR family transcriptional regulator [Clostridium tetanomorphum]
MNNYNIDDFNHIAEILKVLAHPVRLCIVKGLIEKGQCNVTHMQNCLEMPQSTISQHLQKLRTAGIIKGERNGLEINYRICDKKICNLIKMLFEE